MVRSEEKGEKIKVYGEILIGEMDDLRSTQGVL